MKTLQIEAVSTPAARDQSNNLTWAGQLQLQQPWKISFPVAGDRISIAAMIGYLE